MLCALVRAPPGARSLGITPLGRSGHRPLKRHERTELIQAAAAAAGRVSSRDLEVAAAAEALEAGLLYHNRSTRNRLRFSGDAAIASAAGSSAEAESLNSAAFELEAEENAVVQVRLDALLRAEAARDGARAELAGMLERLGFTGKSSDTPT